MRLLKKRIIIFSLILAMSVLLVLSGRFYALAQDYGDDVIADIYTPSVNPVGGFQYDPYTPSVNPVGDFPHYTDVTYTSNSFWQLPLWVQLAYISLTILAAAALIKFVPVVVGRLQNILENPKVIKILSFIKMNPGVSISELSEEQKINRGTLKYYLSRLLSKNMIILVRKGSYTRLFYNTQSPADMESVITYYLKNENSGKLLFRIMDNPGISNQELSEGLELAKSTTYEYLKNFSDDGLIEFRKEGKFKRCYMMQDAHMILLRYRPHVPAQIS